MESASVPIFQNEVATRGVQPANKTAAKAADRIQTAFADRPPLKGLTDLFVNRDIFYRWREGERFAFFGLDIYIIDNQSVRLAEESAFVSGYNDIT